MSESDNEFELANEELETEPTTLTRPVSQVSNTRTANIDVAQMQDVLAQFLALQTNKQGSSVPNKTASVNPPAAETRTAMVASQKQDGPQPPAVQPPSANEAMRAFDVIQQYLALSRGGAPAVNANLQTGTIPKSTVNQVKGSPNPPVGKDKGDAKTKAQDGKPLGKDDKAKDKDQGKAKLGAKTYKPSVPQSRPEPPPPSKMLTRYNGKKGKGDDGRAGDKTFQSGNNSVHCNGMSGFYSSIARSSLAQEAFQAASMYVGRTAGDHVLWANNESLMFVDHVVRPDSRSNATIAMQVASGFQRMVGDQVLDNFRLVYADTVSLGKLDVQDIEGQLDPRNPMYTMANKLRAALTRIGQFLANGIEQLSSKLLTADVVYDLSGTLVPGAAMVVQLADCEELQIPWEQINIRAVPWLNISVPADFAELIGLMTDGTMLLIAQDFTQIEQYYVHVILSGLPRFENPNVAGPPPQHIARYLQCEATPYRWVSTEAAPAAINPPPNTSSRMLLDAMNQLATHLGQRHAVAQAFTRLSTIINGQRHAENYRVANPFVPPQRPVGGQFAPPLPRDFNALAEDAPGQYSQTTVNTVLNRMRDHVAHCAAPHSVAVPSCAPPCHIGQDYMITDENNIVHAVDLPNMGQWYMDRINAIEAVIDQDWADELVRLEAQHNAAQARVARVWTTASYERGATQINPYHDSNLIFRILKANSFRHSIPSLQAEASHLTTISPQTISRHVGIIGALMAIGFSTTFQQLCIRGIELTVLAGNNQGQPNNEFKPWFQAFIRNERHTTCALYIMAINAVSDFTPFVISPECFHVYDWSDGFSNWNDRMRRHGYHNEYHRIPYMIDPISLSFVNVVMLDQWGILTAYPDWDLSHEVVVTSVPQGFFPDQGSKEIMERAAGRESYFNTPYPSIVIGAVTQYWQIRPARVGYVTFPKTNAIRGFRGTLVPDPVQNALEYYDQSPVLKPGQFYTFDWSTGTTISPYLPRNAFDGAQWATLLTEMGKRENIKIGFMVKMQYHTPLLTGGLDALANWHGANQKKTDDSEN